MKKSILTIAIALSAVFGISQSSKAATGNAEEATVLTGINHINKIEIHGNVELYVSDGATDQVKVYNKYYEESALVQDENGLLRVSSYAAKKLVVWVTASDLQNISVYDHAAIKSFGKLSALNIDVKLFDQASAQLDMYAYEAKITLNDHAKADLTGNVTESAVYYDQSASVNTTNLVTLHLVKALNFKANLAKNTAEMASL